MKTCFSISKLLVLTCITLFSATAAFSQGFDFGTSTYPNSTATGVTVNVSYVAIGTVTASQNFSAVHKTSPSNSGAYMNISAGADQNEGALVKLDFSIAIDGLRFNIWDLDGDGTSNKNDKAVVRAYFNQVLQPAPTYTLAGGSGITYMGSGTFLGVADAANNSTTGDVELLFTTTVDSVVVEFTQDGTASNQAVDVSIGDMSFFAILPLSVNEFNARLNNKSVVVNWKYAQPDTKYFEVQRSTDGRNFISVGHASKSANMHASSDYQVIDNISDVVGNSIYYRLRNVHNDNTYSYSRLLLVNVASSGKQLRISPNPVSNILNLQASFDRKATAIIKISNLSGKLVFRKSVSVDQGINSFTEEINGLNPGLYILEITDGVTSYKEKMLKR